MDVKAFHARVQPIVATMNKLLIELETEMSAADEQTRLDAAHSAAVAQARREIEAGIPATPVVAPTVYEPYVAPVDEKVAVVTDVEPHVEPHVATASEKAALEAKQREARLAAQAKKAEDNR